MKFWYHESWQQKLRWQQCVSDLVGNYDSFLLFKLAVSCFVQLMIEIWETLSYFQVPVQQELFGSSLVWRQP